MFSLNIYKNIFMVELLLAEFLFTNHLKKRNHFAIRILISSFVCLLAAFLFPIVSYNALDSSMMFLVLTSLTIVGLLLSFDEPFLNIIYCVVAAYTVRHLAFQFYSLYITLITGSGAVANGIYGANETVFKLDLNVLLSILGYICCYFIVYTIYYTFFGSKIGKDGDFEMQKPNLMVWVLLILFVDILLNAIVVYNSNENNFVNGKTLFINVISTYLYNILCCFFMLFIQYTMIDVRKLKKELSLVNHLWQQEREQYEISKENIDLINRKCHDLKYQIGRIVGNGEISAKQKEEIENMISIYDSMLKTGNEALDVIFAEKSLSCRKDDIKLNCMIDGAKLSFMETADIYALFGNLMDNAMEATKKLKDNEKRIISMNVYVENNELKVYMSNYYEGDLKLDKSGMPITTKESNGYHGFGLRSVFLITHSYNGKINISTDDNIFTLQISIPIV